jgi:hypothetical protein
MKRMRRLGMMMILAVAASSCSLFDYSHVVTRRSALVYGISAYVWPLAANTNPDYNPNLSYPHLDAKDMAALLERQGYTVRSRWVDELGFVWVDGVKGSRLDMDDSEAPSKSVIESDLASLTDSMGSDDQFLFYFSGHGMQYESAEYIATLQDVWTSSVYDGETCYGLADVAVSAAAFIKDAEMGALLSTYIPTARKIVILDTCNSGGFIGDGLEVDITPGTTDPKIISLATVNTLAQAIRNYASLSSTSQGGVSPYNAAVLSAAGADENSYDDSGLAHGAMTYYLLQTQAEADLNGDGSVTVREAFSYVKAAVEENWNKDFPYYAFTPHVSGGPVDFVLY